MGKHGMAGFSERELKIIQLRTNGVKMPEIAAMIGIPKSSGYDSLQTIYQKIGIDDLSLLTRWAIQNGLDEALPPETAETREIVSPKVYKGKIRLGRLRRAMNTIR